MLDAIEWKLLGDRLQKMTTFDKTQTVFLPVSHWVSHNLKELDCSLTFLRCSRTIAGLLVEHLFEKKKNEVLPNEKRHTMEWRKVIVYEIPLACDFRYIRQTGKCVNISFTKHKPKTPNLEVSKYIEECINCFRI